MMCLLRFNRRINENNVCSVSSILICTKFKFLLRDSLHVMDAFTNPESNTYMLGTVFTLLKGGLEVKAIAITNSQFNVINALNTVLIQLLFAGIWQLVSGAIIALVPSTNRVLLVGLVAFTSANDPWTASGLMAIFLGKILLKGNPKDSTRLTNFKWASVMFLPAAFLACGSLVIILLYPGWLNLGQAAPVHPAAVFLPYVEEPSHSTIVRTEALYMPSTLRSLGSAEAIEYHSLRHAVKVKGFDLPDSNATHPQTRIDWSYHIRAADFGLQRPLNFMHNVTGSCSTEYTWIHRGSIGKEGQMDEYWLWGNESFSRLVPGPTYPSIATLDFSAYPNPSTDYSQTNLSFAFLAETAKVGSITPSNDAWYQTQPANNSFTSLDYDQGYEIKPGRPALSCWQSTVFCLNGVCDSAARMDNLPIGMKLILVSTHSVPAILTIARRAGVSSLKAYTGSVIGQVVDAGSATMTADVEWLVLASYLSSKEVFRDTIMMKRPQGLENMLKGSDGNLVPGSADFVIRSRDVVSLHFGLLLLVPVACFSVWTFAILVYFLKQYLVKEVAGNAVGCRYIWRPYTLKPTQLYRNLDESADKSHIWNGRFREIPFPTESVPSSRPSIYDRGASELVLVSRPSHHLSAHENGGHELVTIACTGSDNIQRDENSPSLQDGTPGTTRR